MAIMEATLTQQYFGQTLQTRFNYLASGTPSAVTYSFALTNALGAIWDGVGPIGGYPTGLMTRIADIQDPNVTFVSLIVRDVNSVTDFFEQPFVNPLVGQLGGDDSGSPTLAVGFRTNRTRTDIRPGQKRFGGVNESVLDPGGVIKTGVIAPQMDPLATEMGAVLSYDDSGNILTFSPCIVKKEKYEVPGSDPVRYAYRYYEDQAVGEANIMTSIIWSLKTQVRTQTSRQYGRGV